MNVTFYGVPISTCYLQCALYLVLQLHLAKKRRLNGVVWWEDFTAKQGEFGTPYSMPFVWKGCDCKKFSAAYLQLETSTAKFQEENINGGAGCACNSRVSSYGCSVNLISKNLRNSSCTLTSRRKHITLFHSFSKVSSGPSRSIMG